VVPDSNRNFAPKILDHLAGDHDTFSLDCAGQLSAPSGKLARLERALAKPPGPIRDQCAMGRACDRVLGDTGAERKKARGEINLIAFGRRDYSESVQLRDQLQIRFQLSHLGLT